MADFRASPLLSIRYLLPSYRLCTTHSVLDLPAGEEKLCSLLRQVPWAAASDDAVSLRSAPQEFSSASGSDAEVQAAAAAGGESGTAAAAGGMVVVASVADLAARLLWSLKSEGGCRSPAFASLVAAVQSELPAAAAKSSGTPNSPSAQQLLQRLADQLASPAAAADATTPLPGAVAAAPAGHAGSVTQRGHRAQPLAAATASPSANLAKPPAAVPPAPPAASNSSRRKRRI